MITPTAREASDGANRVMTPMVIRGLARRSRVAILLILPLLVLYLGVGMLKGANEGWAAWIADVRDVIRRLR